MTTALSRAAQFERELGALLDRLPAGEKLPPVRTMLDQYHISLSTFNKVVGRFKEMGLLNAVHGSGIYVCREKSAWPRRVQVVNILYFGFVPSVNMPGFIHSLTNHLACLISSEGLSSTLTVLPPESTLEEVQAALRPMAPQAVLLVNPYLPTIQEWLRKEGVPNVATSPSHPTEEASAVYLDDAAIMRVVVEHLVGLGHRDLAYLHTVNDRWYLRWAHERERCFYRECTRHGLVPDLRLVRYGGFLLDESAGAMREILASGAPFTAVIADDHVMSGVYRELYRAGRSIPGDVSVIGIDDLELASHLVPSLTTVRLDTAEMARRAVAGLRARAGGEDAPIPRIPPELVVRESTAPARPAEARKERKERREKIMVP